MRRQNHSRSRERAYTIETERLTSKAVIMSVGKFVVDKDGMSAVLVLKTALHAFDLIFWDLKTRPAIPLEAGRFAEAAEAGDKATRRHGEAVASIVGALDGDGKSVREEEETAGAGRSVGTNSSGHCA